MTSSAQLERHADQQRAQISDTLDELRARMTPGQIVDQLSDYVSEGSASAFLRNLRAQCVTNPVPVTFVGAGLAWLLLSGFREPRHERPSALRSAPRDSSRAASRAASDVRSRLSTASDEFTRAAAKAGDQTRQAAGQFGDGLRQGASDLTDTAKDYGDGARRTVHDLRDSVSGAAKSGYDKASAGYDRMAEGISGAYDSAAERAQETAGSVGQTASEVRNTVAGAGSSVARVLREQPLVLAGLGLAIGGLLGAFLPTTELEDKVMGDTSDKFKEKIRNTADETLDKARAVGDRAWQEAREAASDQGLLPLNRDANDAKSKNEPEASLVPQGQEGGEQVPGRA